MRLTLLALGILAAGLLANPWSDAWAQAQPSPQPAASPSPSPAARVAASPTPLPTGIAAVFNTELGNQILVIVGAALITIAGVSWVLSNRAEERPSPEQLEQIRQFVEGDFARYVAQGLTARQQEMTSSIAHDRAWRKVFAHQLDLHNEFYRLDKKIALDVFTARIDEAVKLELASSRES